MLKVKMAKLTSLWLFLIVSMLACGEPAEEETENKGELFTQKGASLKEAPSRTPKPTLKQDAIAPRAAVAGEPMKGSSAEYRLGFDPRSDGFGATVLNLGDVGLSSRGELNIESTPSYSLRSGKPTASQWNYALTFAGLGRGEELLSGEPSSVTHKEGLIRYAYPAGVELYYRHLAHGLEQGLYLSEKRAGEAPLRVVFNSNADTAYEVDAKGSVAKVLIAGQVRFSWSHLKVTDARGEMLHARFESEGPRLELVVEDAEAEYPIHIDPLASVPDWSEYGEDAGLSFGYTVATAGDVNNDGFDDLMVGQPFYSGGESGEGRVLLFIGTAAGPQHTAAWAIESDQVDVNLNEAATAGDVNNDGFDDVLIGAYLWSETPNDLVGGAWLYTGSAAGLSSTADWHSTGAGYYLDYGITVAGVGDLNDDGYDDFAVAEDFWSVDGFDPYFGRVYVYFGQASAPFAANETIISAPADFVGLSDPFGSTRFGQSVAGAGDVNNDGFDDLIIGAPQADDPTASPAESYEGWAGVYLGSASGIATSPSWSRYSGFANAGYGFSVTGIGDSNGDNYSEVAVGAYNYSGSEGNQGRVEVYYGSAAGPSATADWYYEGAGNGFQAGYVVTSAGDVNGDNLKDLVFSEATYTGSFTGEGRVLLYLGTPSGFLSEAQWTATGGQSSPRFGYSIAGPADYNNDGYDDIGVSAWLYNDPITPLANVGAVLIFNGVPTCFIDGDFWQDQERSPSNDCLECDVVSSPSAWSTLDGVSCTDGDLCTENDICNAGVCEGNVMDCGDSFSCTADTCSNGLCENPVTEGCLIGGACIAEGSPSPTNPCQICDPAQSTTSYSPAPVGTSCDELFCMEGESCNAAGVCSGGSPLDCTAFFGNCSIGECSEFLKACQKISSSPDGTLCDDSDACTPGQDTCQSGECQGTELDCSSLDGPCQAGMCEASTGNCVAVPVADGTSCISDDACVVDASCSAGACVGAPRDCTDDNPCTTDTCDSASGCDNAPVADGVQCAAASCSEDGLSALAPALCEAGLCLAPQLEACGDYVCDAGACLNTCASDEDCAQGWCSVSSECVTTNRPPVANPGLNQRVAASGMIYLDGSASYDPDGDSLSYNWVQSGGAAVTLNDADQAVASFSATGLSPETLSFTLEVSDGELERAADTQVEIANTSNSAPVADIEGDAIISLNTETMQLRADNSSDADGDSLTYSWSLVDGNISPELIGQDELRSVLVLPDTLAPGDHFTIRLLVHDGEIYSAPALHEVAVAAMPDAPTINTPAAGETIGDLRPNFSGEALGAELGTVTIYSAADDSLLCAAPVDALSAWGCQSDVELAEGENTVYAIAVDTFGHSSAESAPHSFNIDTALPETPVITTPVFGAVLPAGTISVAGNAGVRNLVSVYSTDDSSTPLCTVEADDAGDFSCEIGDFGDGVYSINAQSTNGTGGNSAFSPEVLFFIDEDGDIDNDGLPDYWEELWGLNSLNPLDASLDADADGLDNLSEFGFGSNPLDGDSDEDGVCDGDEVDPGADTDGDLANNIVDADSDNDGLMDGTELGLTDACGEATDLSQGAFVADEDPDTTTSPVAADSDEDGVRDGAEDPDYNGSMSFGEFDPNDGSTEATNGALVDSDGDGLTDREEELLGSDSEDADSDDDGVLDGQEANWALDLDHDGLINLMDPDSDNDGLADGTENGLASATGSTNEERGRFIADLDPASLSSMLLLDSDGDGLRDGAEDPNLNGRVDADEYDPTDPTNRGEIIDSDEDGLSDAEESHLASLLGQDELSQDADSDDDGVLDGDEANWWDDQDDDGAANMLDHDADEDCAFDGTELGITSATADTDLSVDHFVADADPNSQTYPLLADTDGDLLTEDLEDLNCNGRVDRQDGESDPLDPNDPVKECVDDSDCNSGTCTNFVCVDELEGGDQDVEITDTGNELEGGDCSCQAVNNKQGPKPWGAALFALFGLLAVTWRRRR